MDVPVFFFSRKRKKPLRFISLKRGRRTKFFRGYNPGTERHKKKDQKINVPVFLVNQIANLRQ
jgi:hypothetical protein